MEDEATFSSLHDVKKVNDTLYAEENEIKTETAFISIKSELVEIKEDPDSNNYTETSLTTDLTEQELQPAKCEYSRIKIKVEKNLVEEETVNLRHEELDLNSIKEKSIGHKNYNSETEHVNQLKQNNLNSKRREVTLYKCTYTECKYQSVNGTDYRKHLDTHKTRKYKCSRCSYVAVYYTNYRQHIKLCKKFPESALLKCDDCDFKVRTLGLLLQHKKKHRDESKLLKCPECSHTTMYIDALKKHTERHSRDESTGKMLFSCNKCSFTSRSKTMVTRHNKAVHGNDKKNRGLSYSLK